MKKHKLKEILKGTVFFFGGATAQHLFVGFLDSIIKSQEIAAKEAAESANKEILLTTQQDVQSLKSHVIKLETSFNQNIHNINNTYVDEPTKDKLSSILQSIEEKFGSLKFIFEGKANNDTNGSAEVQEITTSAMTEHEELADIVKKILLNSRSGSDKNNFIPDFNLDRFYEYLDSLSFIQELAFLHILILLLLMIILFNILGVFFGNEIIKYFNIEKKFPSLAVFFKLRSTYQRYYLLWNTFLMFFICFAGIFMDIMAYVVNP